MSDSGLTGSARVLAILRHLGEQPAGARLGDVAAAVQHHRHLAPVRVHAHGSITATARKLSAPAEASDSS